MFKLMFLKLLARFSPLAERLVTSQGRNIRQTKEVTAFPGYFFRVTVNLRNMLLLVFENAPHRRLMGPKYASEICLIFSLESKHKSDGTENNSSYKSLNFETA